VCGAISPASTAAKERRQSAWGVRLQQARCFPRERPPETFSFDARAPRLSPAHRRDRAAWKWSAAIQRWPESSPGGAERSGRMIKRVAAGSVRSRSTPHRLARRAHSGLDRSALAAFDEMIRTLSARLGLKRGLVPRSRQPACGVRPIAVACRTAGIAPAQSRPARLPSSMAQSYFRGQTRAPSVN